MPYCAFSNLDWGDVPTRIASIGTMAAIVVALWQIRGDRRQVATRERRAQAESISAWYDGDSQIGSDLVVRNSSEQPIYEVVVTLVIDGHTGRRALPDHQRTFLVVPPGNHRVRVGGRRRGMSAAPGAEVAFSDRTGAAHWVRRADGSLIELEGPPIEYYDISRPFISSQLEGL